MESKYLRVTTSLAYLRKDKIIQSDHKDDKRVRDVDFLLANLKKLKNRK